MSVHFQDNIFCTIDETGFIRADELWLAQRNTANHASPMTREKAEQILTRHGIPEYRWIELKDWYESMEAAMENELISAINHADFHTVDYDITDATLEDVQSAAKYEPVGIYRNKLYIGGNIWWNNGWKTSAPGDYTAFMTGMIY